MNGHMFTSTFMFRMMSQADWRTQERCETLIRLALDPALGTFTHFALDQRTPRSRSKLVLADLILQARNGAFDHLVLDGELPAPTQLILSWDRMRYTRDYDFPVGKHMLAVFRSRKAGPVPGDSLRVWVDILERHAGLLALRYSDISCPKYSLAKLKETYKWISPQYADYATRVMLFGPREIERFGRDYLLAAPAHEVKLLDCGSVLIIASPHSLDPSAPEDEEALARLNDYLLAHPRAGVLM